MASNFKSIWTGLKIKAKAVLASDTKGELEVNDSNGKLNYHNGVSRSPIVTEDHTATLTNKSIDADTNTITNIENADIKAAAAIDATKIADGSVSNAEFQQLAAIGSAVVGISDTQTLTNKTIDADLNTITNIENADIKSSANIDLAKLASLTASKALVSDVSGVITTSATTNTELGYVSGVTSAIQTQLNNKIESSEKGANNGVATLDGGGKVPTSQLPSSVMTYEGTYNASTNTPTLADGTGNAGMVYLVSVAGTQNLGSGSITFAVGDWVVYSGTIWEKSSNSNLVMSVNGQTGVVVITKTDLGLGNVDNTSDATKNSATVTLTNKSLVDSSTAIVDAADSTKQIKFDANGTASTSTTIQSSQTVDRVITLPDVSDTLVGVGATQTLTNKTLTNPTISQINNGGAVTIPSGITTLVGTNSTQTLTNKSLVDASTTIVGSADATKKVIFENGPAATNTTLTLQSSQTVNRVITFPDSSDTVVVAGLAQTLANKTLTAPVLNSPSVVTPSRSDVKQGTKSALTTYATTAANGQLVFATDTKEYLAVKDGVLVDIGGGAGGVGNTDTLMSQTFDKAALTDFTQTGMELVASPFIQGAFTARLIHQAASTYSFKQIVAANPKFRGQLNTLAFSARSTALSANVTVTITDETNSTVLLSSTFTTGQITAAVFNTASSTTVTVTDNSIKNQILVGASISGSGIPTGTTVTAVSSSTNTITISQAATATATGVSLKVSVLPKTQKYSFAMPASCASVSYTITALAESGLPETYVDDVQIYLSQSANSSYSLTQTTFNATDWTSYTPTFTGFGTPSAVEFEYRQVGGNYEIRGKFISGTATATEARISLPAGATSAGTSIIPSTQLIGSWTANTANTYFGTTLISPSVTYLNLGLSGAGTAGPTPLNASSLVSSGVTMVLNASVPIAGLTANTTTTSTIPLTSSVLVTQPDSYLRMATTSAVTLALGTTDTKILSLSNIPIQENIGNSIQYLDSAANGARFVALQEGLFHFSFFGDLNTAAGYFGISKNSTSLTTNVQSIPSSELLALTYDSGSADSALVYAKAYLKVGDTVRLHASQAVNTTTPVTFSVSYQGSTKILNPSSDQKIQIPTHQLRFEGASARGSTDTAIVKFDTQTITQGDGFTVVNTAANGTVVTIKKAGKLNVQASVQATASGDILYISKNQVVLTSAPTASETVSLQRSYGANAILSAAGFVDVLVGDIIRVSLNNAVVSQSAVNFTLSLQETSVAVALQNVTPTYDNSDSCVQLRTANGYGSTNTKYRRFSNTLQNFGSDIVYTDSSSDGASFTIQKDGLYEISYTEVLNASSHFGIVVGDNQGTTILSSTTAANIIAQSITSAANQADNISVSVYLTKGSVIRAKTEGDPSGTNGTVEAKFTISRVGKTSGNVDITPFVQIPTQDVEAIEALTATTTFGSTNTGIPVLSVTKNTNKGIIQVLSDSASGTSFKALKDCEFKIAASATAATTVSTYYVTRNSTTLTTGGTNGVVASSDISNTYYSALSTVINLAAGDIVRLHRVSTAVTGFSSVMISATAINNNIVNQTQQVSSDTMSFVFQSTALTGNEAIGTFNTYTYTANTNTATISSTAPTQTTSSMNINGIQVFARAANATSTAASPARVDILIGKGLKSKQIDAYGALAKATQLCTDMIQVNGTSEYGSKSYYNESTGILTIEAATYNLAATVNRVVGTDFNGNATYSSGYFVFNASKIPSLVSIPNLAPRVAVIKDVKTAGTNGGSSVASTWTARDLNTVDDPTGIIDSLSANTVTLKAGQYYIESTSPFERIGAVKTRIFSTTSTTTLLTSDSMFVLTTGDANAKSMISGTITLTSTQSIQLQYYTGTAFATYGLGEGNAAAGVSDIFSQVKITKIK